MSGYFVRKRGILVAAGLLIAAGAAAQPARDFRTIDRLIEQERDAELALDRTRSDLAPWSNMFEWQWGGWVEYYVFDFDDGVQSQRTLQRPSLYLWTRLRADDGAHEAFARMRLTYEYFNPGDQISRQQDWIGPNLDRGWYQIDLARALDFSPDPVNLTVRIGRQETLLGTGYVLDLPLDAVTFQLDVEDWRLRGLVGKTIGSYPNIDSSQPVNSHSARRMFGAELSYEGWNDHVPFAYALWNDDYTDERPEVAFQNYAYDTRYFGAGMRGALLHNLNYWAEAVYEGGHSYGLGQFSQRDTVDAWGLNAGLEKLWDHTTRPRAALEYMFASGDADRVFSPTNAGGGNRFDSKDSSFSAFGYRDTGISAAMLLSNVHVWKLGGSLTPFPDVEILRDFEVGTNWFLYHKHHRAGAIGDPTATRGSGYVGWEMDYFLNWRIASDLSWTLRWGSFFPGNAYDDRGTRHFLFTGLTWSF